MDPDPHETSPIVQSCPACFGMVQVPPGSAGQTVFCPHCGESFPAAGETAALDFVHADHRDEAAEDLVDEADRLSMLRIQNLARERRAAWRTTSYFVAATGGCVLAVAEILYRMLPGIRQSGAGIRVLCILLVALFLAGAGYFLKSAIAFAKIANRRPPEEPLKPPDFSTLSDGSQHVKNLEEMGRTGINENLETPKPGLQNRDSSGLQNRDSSELKK
jgi:hypothetical protein